MSTIFTSIAPHLRRSAEGVDVTEQYLKECIASWQDLGFKIVSLNSAEECKELRRRFPEVKVLKVNQKVPRIVDFLDAARSANGSLVGIANCDCIFQPFPAQISWILDNASGGLVVMERINFSREKVYITGKSCKGFDAFLFPRSAASNIKMPNDLHIGETWWDYAFPLAFVEAGLSLSYCAPLFHLDHPLAWSENQWRLNAIRMKGRFASLLCWDDKNQSDAALYDFAVACFDRLCEKAVKQQSFVGRMSEGIITGSNELRERQAQHSLSPPIRSPYNGPFKTLGLALKAYCARSSEKLDQEHRY